MFLFFKVREVLLTLSFIVQGMVLSKKECFSRRWRGCKKSQNSSKGPHVQITQLEFENDIQNVIEIGDEHIVTEKHRSYDDVDFLQDLEVSNDETMNILRLRNASRRTQSDRNKALEEKKTLESCSW